MGNIKIKTDGSAFLTEISQITLDGSFQANLRSAIDQINENFSKIISLPFLQGDAGDSVETVTIKLSESSELKNAIATAIYNNSNHNNHNDANYGGTINGVGSWNEEYQNNREVVFYRKKEITSNGERFFFYSPSLYLFIDDRIKMLSQTLDDSILMSFRDLSCALTISGEADMNPTTGEPTECVFTATKQDIIPNLYYDTDSKYWCWSINGVKTKVIAQGVKGDPGIDAKVFICNGEKLANQTSSVQNIIKITEILQPLSDDNTAGVATPETIPEGSLLVVWFDDNTADGNSSNINNCTFGVARHAENYVYISTSEISSINLDLATLISSLNLYRELNDITNPEPENNEYAIRGLYVPDCSDMNDDEPNSYVHMSWADGGVKADSNNTVNIGLVHSSKRLMSAGGIIEENGDAKGYSTTRGKLDIKYPEVVSYKTSLKKDPGDMTIGVQAYDKSYSSSPISVTIPSSNTITVGEENLQTDGDKKRVVVSEGSVLIENRSSGTGKKPSLIIDQDEHTSSHIINGELNLDNVSMRIGNTSKYDLIDLDFGIRNMDQNRWSLKNKGIKLHNSDIIVHGGSLVSSSYDNFGAVSLHNNSLQFDYKIYEKVNKNLVPAQQDKSIKESRPRHIDFVPVKIGGYSTIYNSITNNANRIFPHVGEVNNVISDVCNPLILTPEDNRKNAFISGKMGYTAMVENHGVGDIFQIDGVTESDGTKDGKLCLLTSYDAIWTKIGNVVDVKGKIFFNSARFSTSDNKISVSNPEPLTYSQFFKFFTENGNKIGFPLPVVINSTQEDDKDCYQISTGNLLDNKTIDRGSASGKKTTIPLVNKPIIVSDSDDYHEKSPSISINSSYQYHNDILNGTANFHFYGNRIGNLSDGLGIGLDVTNEVFSVSAGISKHPNYDDRYWGLCHIPNYDIINCVRSGHATNFDNTSSDNRPFLNSISSDDNGPVKIVEVEQDSEKYCPQTSRYQYTNAIIGNRYYEKIDDNTASGDLEFKQCKYKGGAGVMNLSNDESASEDYSYIMYGGSDSREVNNFYEAINMSSQHAYKISTNIGPYRIRYITFSFSYILEDDIPNYYIMNSNGKYICDNKVGMPDTQQYPNNPNMTPTNPGILDSEFIESISPEIEYESSVPGESEEIKPGDITQGT